MVHVVFAHIRRWADPRLAALVLAFALALAPASCGEISEGDAVQGTVEITAQGAAGLTLGSIQWIDGTYGAGCIGRASGNWSARVSGNATMDYSALSVVTNNTACTLTLTKIVADTTYTGSSSIALGGSYAGSASSFTASAALTPTKDTYVTGGASASNNYGANSTIDLKYHTASFDRAAWLSFNTTGYSNISSAILSLYLAGVGMGESSPSPQDQAVKAYYAPTASDSWTEGTGTTNVPTMTGLTWSNATSPGDTPSAGTSIASTTVPAAATVGTTFTWDVTSGVRSDTDGTATLVLSSWENGDTNHALQFGARESANPPSLAINYGLFYGNAYLSSTTFSSAFVINLLVSDNPSASTASVTGFGAHCTASTPVWVTGFESGVISSTGASVTPGASLLNGVTGAPTADQTLTRSGNAALNIVKTNGSSQYVQKTNLGTPTTAVMSLGIRFSSLPAANQTELAKIALTSGASAVLGFNQATSQFTMGFSGGTLQNGPASTAAWGASSFNTSDVYHIVNNATGLCLDDPSGVATNNNPIDLATCSANSKMSWKFVTAGTGYQLVNQSESCMLNQAGSTSSGGLLNIWCNASSSTNLRWNVSGNDNGYAQIVSQTATSMCVGDPSSGGAGTQQDQETCSSTAANEMWSIVDQTNATGAIVAGRWYRIDLRIKVGANPNTIDWQVNGVSQTQATMAQAATTLTGAINLGSTVSADVYTAWYDDVIVTTSSADYPILSGQVLFLVPASYIGKSDPNTYMKYWNTGSGTLQTVGSTSWSVLDKFPMTATTPYVQQSTSNATSYYAEYGFGAVTNTSCINGVSAVVELNATSSTADTAGTDICYGGTCTVIHNDSFASVSEPEYRSLSFGVPGGGTWSSTNLTGLQAQVGYYTAAGGTPQWDALLLEYDQAPRSSTSYTSVITADSPVGYWRFGEVNGTSAIPTVGSITGTYTNSPTLGVGGLVGDGDTAMRLNGIATPNNSYVDFPTGAASNTTYNFSGTASFSVEFWINPPAAGSTYPGIVTKMNSSGYGWAVQLDKTSNTVAFFRQTSAGAVYADSGDSWTNGNLALVPGTWYHVVGTYDGTNEKIYVNGVQYDQVSGAINSSQLSLPSTTSTDLQVGNSVTGVLDPCGGTIDELALYNVALSQAQVTAHYNAGKP